MTFAAQTSVPVSKTQGEIRAMMEKAGATAYASFEEVGRAMIAFKLQDRNIRISIKVPVRPPTEKNADANRRMQKERTAWRALKLVIKAKLESVEAGIETIEEAFLSHVVMKDGRTVYETISEPLALEYQGKSVPLLPGPRE